LATAKSRLRLAREKLAARLQGELA
jgi:DNA-directed RNA polymerase specialized sigma24 family protein